jgi:isoleucyl-tRNA synthetase
MAPFAPFLPEHIYLNLKGSESLGSVHLEEYPCPDEALIDSDLERQMGMVMQIVSQGRAARNKVQIKVRQPLRKILVAAKDRDLIAGMEWLVEEELNVKGIECVENVQDYVNYEVKPNFPVMGPRFGRLLKSIARELASSDARSIAEAVHNVGHVDLQVDGEAVRLTAEDLSIRMSEREGFVVDIEGDVFVILDTELTEDLILEGIAREVVSKVQTMRRNSGFNVVDHIELWLSGDDVLEAGVRKHEAYIKRETLCDRLELVPRSEAAESDSSYEEWDVNGHDTLFKVKRVVGPNGQ